MAKISVIIPTYNRAQMVCDCVRSVLATNYPELEVIVVDDCSPDDTGARIAAEFGNDSRVKYTRNKQNSQSAISRNNGARLADGEFLFFLDDDNILRANIFTEMLACFDRHSEAGLVAPLTLHHGSGEDPLVWTVGADFHRWTSRTNDATNGNIPLSQVLQMPQDLPTTYSPNAFLVKREAHEKVGGFDEHMRMQYDESDYGWRILEAGYSEFIARDAITDHYGYTNPSEVPALRAVGMENAKRTYCFARNRMIFARRHFSPLQAAVISIFWAPVFAAYYCQLALRHRRPDIAWAYLRGTFRGMLGL